MYIFLVCIDYKLPVSICEFILIVIIFHVDSTISTILSTNELGVCEKLTPVPQYCLMCDLQLCSLLMWNALCMQYNGTVRIECEYVLYDICYLFHGSIHAQ